MRGKKFFKRNANDEAVSPVIAVILMVAITVVLAATVYVWVSGFSNNSGSASASISVAQIGGVVESPLFPPGTAEEAKFTVTSVSAGFDVQNLKIIDATNGVTYNLWTNLVVFDDGDRSTPTYLVDGDKLSAGDLLVIFFSPGTLPDGSVLQLVDTLSNNVIASVYVR